MNSKIFWQSLGSIVVVFALVLSVSSYIASSPTTNTTPNERIEVTVSISIQDMYESKEVKTPRGSSILDLLNSLNNSNPLLALKTKEYKGLGTLVDSMAGKTNGTDKKYWQFFVNGAMPQVGADKFKLSGNEKIEWKFEASQY